MSFLYYNDKTPHTKAIFKSLKADEYWVKDPVTGDYIPLSGGGGTPGELPYYLKANSIKVEGEGTSTLIDSNSIDVNDLTEEKGASLLADRLIFGESGNNSSLTKGDVDFYSKLKNVEDGALITNTTAAAGTVPVVYNPTTKAFAKSRVVYLEESGSTLAYMTPTSFKTQLSATNSVSVSVYNGIISDNGTHRFRVANGVGGLGYRNKASLKGTHMDETAITVGDMTGDGFYATGKHLRLFENSLLLKDAVETVVMNKGDVKITNNLKALSGITPGANSKMVVIDTTTGTYNHADIPSGGSAPTGNVYTLTIPAYSGTTSFLPHFSGDTVTELDTPVGPATLRRYLLNIGDTLILKTAGSPQDDLCLYYNTWYCVAISKQALNYTSSKYAASLVNVPINAYAHTIDIASSPINHPAVPLGSILFRINAFNGSVKKTNTNRFDGAVVFKVLSYENSDSPAPTTI